MKKILSVLLAAVMLLSVGVAAFASDEAQTPDYTTGTPWPDIDLEGVVTEDMTAELKDNFALYVNKDKILSTEIPAGMPAIGSVVDLELQGINDMKEMFLGDEPESHDAKLAYNLFQLMMDWDTRNELGVSPLKEEVDQVEAIDTVDALMAYYTDVPLEDQLAGLWDTGQIADFEDSSRYILAIAGSIPLLRDDSAEYSELTEYGSVRQEANSELAQKILVKMGYTEDEAAQKLDNCLAFETLLTPALYTKEEQGRPDYLERVNNRYTLEELRAAQGKLPILEVFAKTGYPEAEVYQVFSPALLEKLNEVCTEDNLPLIRDYMIVQGILSSSTNLDRECYDWSQDCLNTINGSTGSLDDESIFAAKISRILEWPVARLYTETYLKQEDKDRIAAMSQEILDVYPRIISEADFLSDETKAKAIEKVEAMEMRILYPDDWTPYSCDELDFAGPKDGGTLWQALKNIDVYRAQENVETYSKPVDRDKWIGTPQTVNCGYHPQSNTFYIMGAFARGSVYDSEASDEELLAKLGTVIGHEISHAFDSTGAQFDKDGNLANWWTEEDLAAFHERNDKLAAYYDAMHPWEGQDFNSSIMTGEACADMAGFKCILLIAAEKEDFDYDAFFRAYADLWFTKDTLQMAYVRINDAHPMGYLRINCTLQQCDEFLDFYGIQEGDGMYLAPADRVNIW